MHHAKWRRDQARRRGCLGGRSHPPCNRASMSNILKKILPRALQATGSPTDL